MGTCFKGNRLSSWHENPARRWSLAVVTACIQISYLLQFERDTYVGKEAVGGFALRCMDQIRANIYLKNCCFWALFSAPYALACLCAQSCPVPCVPMGLTRRLLYAMGFFQARNWVGCHFLLQGILHDRNQTHCKQILYLLSRWEACLYALIHLTLKVSLWRHHHFQMRTLGHRMLKH